MIEITESELRDFHQFRHDLFQAIEKSGRKDDTNFEGALSIHYPSLHSERKSESPKLMVCLGGNVFGKTKEYWWSDLTMTGILKQMQQALGEWRAESSKTTVRA